MAENLVPLAGIHAPYAVHELASAMVRLVFARQEGLDEGDFQVYSQKEILDEKLIGALFKNARIDVNQKASDGLTLVASRVKPDPRKHFFS